MTKKQTDQVLDSLIEAEEWYYWNLRRKSYIQLGYNSALKRCLGEQN